MICAFFNSVQELASTSAESATALTEFIQALDQVAGFSRELRPPLQKIRDALRGVRDAQAIIDEWVRRIDSSPIDCTEIASLPLT